METRRRPDRWGRRARRGQWDQWGRDSRWHRWATLVGAIVAIVTLMAAAQRWSPTAPGPAAGIYLNNLDREYTPAAYFYTEVTDVAEFVADDGRYGGGTK